MGQYDVHVNGKTSAAATTTTIRPRASTTRSTRRTRSQAGQPLALGALYHYWTCTCQGRANGPASNTTLSAAQAVGATNIKVGAVNVFDVGDQITVGTGAAAETATVTAVGTTGATGTGVTRHAGAHARRTPAASRSRPSGPVRRSS